MGVFMKLKILLWVLYIFFKSCEKKKRENTSGIRDTEKEGGHCWAPFQQVPPFTYLSFQWLVGAPYRQPTIGYFIRPSSKPSNHGKQWFGEGRDLSGNGWVWTEAAVCVCRCQQQNIKTHTLISTKLLSFDDS